MPKRRVSISCTSTACPGSSTCRSPGARRRALRLRQRRRPGRVSGAGPARLGSGSGARDRVPRFQVRADRLFRNDLTVGADGTRVPAFHRRDARKRHRTPRLRHGRRRRRLQQRRLGRSVPHQLRRANQLLRNNGDGTFSDVSKASGTDHRSWSVSAAFVDFDRDGWLDLYVGNYLRYSLESNTPCFSAVGRARLLHAGQLSAAAGPAVPQPRRRHVRRRRASASGIAREFGPGARRRRPPTSTATAGSTSTSPTTARRTSSG